MKKVLLLSAAFLVAAIASCRPPKSQVIHTKIAETIDTCLCEDKELMNSGMRVNNYLIKDYDSINISMLFYLDSNDNICYEVFSFHKLANDSIPFLGCYSFDDRTLLYIYDESGLAHNFVDTTQLIKPWPSRLDHVYRYPDFIDDLFIEGLDYFYVAGYLMDTKEKDGALVLEKVNRMDQISIDENHYSFYPRIKSFLGW